MTNAELPQIMHSNKLRFSVQVFIVGAILAVTFLLLFVAAFKTYSSSIIVLVNTKSELSVKNQQQIVGNIIEFPQTLSFYEKLLKNNQDVRDFAAGQSQDQRKKTWNKTFSIKSVGANSSVIKISITAKRESDANQLVQKTARTFFDTVGNYYNIKNDLDLRIIDGPITNAGIIGWYWMLPVSIFFGFLTALFLQSILEKSRQIFWSQQKKGGEIFADLSKFFQKKTDQKIESLEDLYMPEEIAEKPYFSENHNKVEIPSEKTSQIKEMKSITKIIQQNKYPNFPEMPVHEMKKSEAPDNLPVAEDFPIQSFEAQEKPQIETRREPTAEELRERLNRLLKGEL